MKEQLLHPAALGFYAGMIFFGIASYHLIKLKFEHNRYKRMLSDKLEIEANTMSKMKGELEAIKKENENLRIKVQSTTDNGDGKLTRDLEIFARAEKKMMVAAPGFAGPWEQAKQAAFQELAEEDTGRVAPKRFFQRFFGGAVQAANGSSSGQPEQVRALPSAPEHKPDEAHAG
jgi:hypothetical protein